MLIEHEDAIVLDESEWLADTLVGGLWTSFRNSIPALQATELDKVFNLIMMADGESLMPSQITSVLIDEYLDLSVKKQTVYVVIATNIIDLLTRMGVTLDEDIVGEDKLSQLFVLANFFFELKEYEDLIGLKGLLESYDIPPVDRYLRAMSVYWGEDFDISEYECLVQDVSEVTLKTIKDALFNPDDVETPPEPLQRRVIANKELLMGTKAYDHVVKNGQLGCSMISFLSFYKEELETIMEKDTLAYAKEVLGFYLISEINNEYLKDKVTQYLYSMITDVVTLGKVEALIDSVVIPE